jgi:hypothetical protein
LGQDKAGEAYQILSSTEIHESDGTLIGRDIHCSCLTGDDHIVVWRLDGTTPISPLLSEPSDFDGTLWLIDIANRGLNSIALLFSRSDGQLIAEVYQDQDGDDRVAVSGSGSSARIVEPGTWSIRVVAVDGYWQHDGRLAPNLNLLVDDHIAASFGSEVYENLLKNDGVLDFAIRVRGPRQNDPRSYDWRNVYTPISESSGILRTTLMVRESGQEPTFAPQFPWYFLGNRVGMVKPYGESFPPIQVDTQERKIAIVGEFVASRGSDLNWFTYSLIRVEPDVLTEPNFESPFAYYDLAEDHDSVPELQVRVDRTLVEDPFRSSPIGEDRPVQQIRYSWDQDNSQNWSYKLGLLGSHDVEGSVVFPEFALRTIPYHEVPRWVTQQTWDIATFVAAEGPLWTSEGIYDWDPDDSVNRYYSGLSESIGSFDAQITQGLRGELARSLHDKPWLYFSPVDQQLHLANAESGRWNIDGNSELRYLNSAGGANFDGWQRWTNGILTAQLYRIPGGLLYSDDRETLLLQADIPTESFRTLPPTNHDEWLRLGGQINRNRRDLEPGNLRAMFDQFGGSPRLLAAGQLTGFERTGAGVAFIVRSDDDATRNALAALSGRDPGQGLQRISIEGHRVDVSPVTFAEPIISIAVEQKGPLQTVPVRITITNSGTLDLTNAVLDVRAVRSDNRFENVLGLQTVDMTGRDELILSFPWAPGQPGTWTLHATLRSSVPELRSRQPIVLQQQAQQINVTIETSLSSADAVRLGWSGGAIDRLAIWIGLIVATTGIGAVALWKGQQR